MREDSLVARWDDPPPDLAPGSKAGDPVRCLAFLRLAHDALPGAPWTAYRPVDAATRPYPQPTLVLALLPGQMQALLDSMWAIAALRTPRSEPGDSLVLMIRAEGDGQERVYESTVDQESFLRMVRALAAILPGGWKPPMHVSGAVRAPDYTTRRSNIFRWTSQFDPRCGGLWRH